MSTSPLSAGEAVSYSTRRRTPLDTSSMFARQGGSNVVNAEGCVYVAE